MNGVTGVDRAPLLMLHGIGSTAAGWQPQIEALRETHRAHAWNAPGYADSPGLPSQRPQVADYAIALGAWMDHLALSAATLVASSWGSLIAMSLAAMEPRRVTRLILSGPSAGAGHLPRNERDALRQTRSDRAKQAGIASMLAQDTTRLVAAGTAEATLARIVHAQQGVTLAGYLQALHSLVEADGVELIRRVGCPVLLIAGNDDLIAPPGQHAVRLAQAAPDAELVRFAHCGHLPHAEYPGLFIEQLRAFTDA